MNSVFSVDDFPEGFWSSPLPAPVHEIPMNRSQSEWELEKFLEEVAVSPRGISASSVGDNMISPTIAPSGVSQPSVSRAEEGVDDDVVEIGKPDHDQTFPRALDPHPSSAPVHSDEYRAFLKNKLDLACAAVALRGSPVKPEERSTLGENEAQAVQTSQLASLAPANASTGQSVSVPQTKSDAGPLSTTAIPPMQRKPGVQVRQATSGSSREDSDDDDLEGDMENLDCLDPSDDKRARRMQSNRESARRSRRRKQAHLNELETQAGQLRVEHSSLLKGLTDVNKKYDEAAVNNRILKADIETLRAKVKMAEETVKRVTGLNPLLLARSNAPPSISMPFVSSSSMDAPTNAAIPMQPNPNQFLHRPPPSIATAPPNHHRLDCGFPSNTHIPVGNPRNDSGGGRHTNETPPLQRAVSIEHAQQQIGNGVNPSRGMPGWESGLPHSGSKNEKQK